MKQCALREGKTKEKEQQNDPNTSPTWQTGAVVGGVPSLAARAPILAGPRGTGVRFTWGQQRLSLEKHTHRPPPLTRPGPYLSRSGGR